MAERTIRTIKALYEDRKKHSKENKDWKASLEAKKTKDSGYNSFIANAPVEEFQVDLLFFRQEGDQEP